MPIIILHKIEERIKAWRKRAIENSIPLERMEAERALRDVRNLKKTLTILPEMNKINDLTDSLCQQIERENKLIANICADFDGYDDREKEIFLTEACEGMAEILNKILCLKVELCRKPSI